MKKHWTAEQYESVLLDIKSSLTAIPSDFSLLSESFDLKHVDSSIGSLASALKDTAQGSDACAVSLRSLNQIAFLIYNKYIPLLLWRHKSAQTVAGKAKKSDDPPRQAYVPPALRKAPAPVPSEDARILTALKYFSAWSAVDGSGVMACWPLFLSDGFRVEKELAALASDSTLSAGQWTRLPKYSSLLMFTGNAFSVSVRIGALSAATASVATDASRRWLLRLKGKKYDADKVLRMVVKVLRACVVLLCVDEGDETLSACLDAITRILTICPLQKHFDSDPLIPLEEACGEMWSVVLSACMSACAGTGRHHNNLQLTNRSFVCLRWLCKEIKNPWVCLEQALTRKYEGGSFLDCVLQVSRQGYDQQMADVFVNLQHSLLQTHTPLFQDPAILSYWYATTADREIQAHILYVELLLRGNDPSRANSTSSRAIAIDLWPVLRGMLDDGSNHLVQLRALEACAHLKENASTTEEVLALFVQAAGHEISTVRAAAFRSLGALLKDSTGNLLDALLKGCRDTNLAVRVQATWAFTKYLQSHADLWTDYTAWVSALTLAQSLIRDSDKLRATALLAIAYLIRSLPAALVADRFLEDISSVYVDIRQHFLGGMVEVNVMQLSSQFTQKVLSASAFALGAILHRLPQDQPLAEDIFLTLVCMLRDGFVNLRILSARLLHTTLMQMTHVAHLLRLLEAITIVLDRSPSLQRPVRIPAVQAVSVVISKAREEVLACGLLLLLQQVLTMLIAQEEGSKAVQALDCCSEALLSFLERSVLDAYDPPISIAADHEKSFDHITPSMRQGLARSIAAMLLTQAHGGNSSSALPPIVAFRLHSLAGHQDEASADTRGGYGAFDGLDPFGSYLLPGLGSAQGGWSGRRDETYVHSFEVDEEADEF